MEQAEAIQKAQALGQWFDAWVVHLRDVGRNCALGGDARWEEALRQLGVTPLTAEERARHVADGPLSAKKNDPNAKGAVPIEMRWALEALETKVRAELRPIDFAIEIANDHHVKPMETRLNNLVDEEMRDHLTAVMPKPTTSSIFANAMSTTPNWNAQGVAQGIQLEKCKSCGAPQKHEAQAKCIYCGAKWL